MIAIIFGIICIFSTPLVAHADLFGFEIQDVYADITENVKETNDILNKAFKFSQTSPYEVINAIAGTEQGNIAVNVRNASKSMALVVATMLLMVEFFRKTINFEWSSKWENILIFLIKILVIKQVIQNADVIVSYIYAGFQSINKAAAGSSIDFLPYGEAKEYSAKVSQSISEHLHKSWWDFWTDIGEGDVYNTYTYEISENAVKMFYPQAWLPEIPDLNAYPLAKQVMMLPKIS